MNDHLDFKYGSGTDAKYGCGLTLKDQFWYFGGTDPYYRQVRSGRS